MKPQFKDAIELLNEGYPPDEIARELGISRATAYRWVRQHETSLSLAGMDDNELEDDHEDFIDEVEDDNNDDDDEVENNSHLEGLGAVLEKGQKARSAKLKTTILAEFGQLIEGLQEHCMGSEWKSKELRKIVSSCNSILGQSEELQALEEIDYRDSSLIIISEWIKSLFKHYCSEFGNEVQIRWDEPKIKLLQTATEIDSLADTNFDLQDYERQAAWFKFNNFVQPIMDLSGVLEKDELEELKSDLEITKEALTDDLRNDLQDEFKDEVSILEELESFLDEYDQANTKAFFGKSFKLPSEILEQIEEILKEETELKD